VIKKKKISQEDNNSWQKYINNPTDIFDKDNIEKENNFINNRFKYDLHGYTLIEANQKVKELILLCAEQKEKEILLITGHGLHSNTDKDIYVSKNLSKLKYSVPEFIKSNPNISKHILSIANANKIDGGDGAIIIKLKKL
jgi:DNA-nicking Smr family endonuclease